MGSGASNDSPDNLGKVIMNEKDFNGLSIAGLTWSIKLHRYEDDVCYLSVSHYTEELPKTMIIRIGKDEFENLKEIFSVKK